MDTQLLEVVKKALWNQNDVVTADQAVFLEMKAHHIEALAAPVLYELGLAQDILDEWEKNIVKHIGMYMRYKQIQSCLPISVPYVILKGTAAAQYYPYPEYRTFGDIDIMTSHENHQRACEQLRNHGFLENTNAIEQEVERHRTFIKKGIVVEVHSFYALRDDPKETEIMDDLIIQNINPAHILPDLINGLTLIEHINHHMEEGIGLRQILDWMMFVDKCLPDEKWKEFKFYYKRKFHDPTSFKKKIRKVLFICLILEQSYGRKKWIIIFNRRMEKRKFSRNIPRRES